MRKFCGLVAAIGLIVSPLAWAKPLSAGKPANIRQAQMTTGSWVVIGSLGAIALTVIAVAASGDDNNGQAQSSTTTSSTATSS
jgi:urocanate hydratase